MIKDKEYNDSPLTNEQWEQAEKLCASDEILTVLWENFKWMYSGANKKAIDTYDKWITFTETAVDIVTGNVAAPDDADGKYFRSEEKMRNAVKSMLNENEFKTAERVITMLKSYNDLLIQREKLLTNLSSDDSKEVATSRLSELAKKHKP